jgi:hypothetical protein
MEWLWMGGQGWVTGLESNIENDKLNMLDLGVSLPSFINFALLL